jgi:exosome complex RNA-binding protein Csl4
MLDQDCADICRLSGQVIERNSENVELFLKLCGALCEKCATECEKHSHMEHCKKCAEACRKCADMCNNYQPAQIK